MIPTPHVWDLQGLDLAITTLREWEEGLPDKRRVRHPVLYRLRTIQSLLETFRATQRTDLESALTSADNSVRAGQRWAEMAQEDPTKWHFPVDNADDMIKMLADIPEMIALDLVQWEYQTVKERTEQEGVDRKKVFEEHQSYLSRIRALRAVSEALMLCIWSGNVVAKAWLPIVEARLQIIVHEIFAWRAAELLVESRGNRWD